MNYDAQNHELKIQVYECFVLLKPQYSQLTSLNSAVCHSHVVGFKPTYKSPTLNEPSLMCTLLPFYDDLIPHDFRIVFIAYIRAYLSTSRHLLDTAPVHSAAKILCCLSKSGSLILTDDGGPQKILHYLLHRAK